MKCTQIIIGFFPFLVLLACSTENKQKETHSIESIVDQETNYTEDNLKDFLNSIKDEYDISITRDEAKAEQYTLRTMGETTNTVVLVFNQFSDTLKCTDSYGTWQLEHSVDDKKMKFDEDFGKLVPEQVFLLKMDNSILIMYADCTIDNQRWISLKDELFNSIKGIRNRINFDCHGTLLEQSFCCL